MEHRAVTVIGLGSMGMGMALALRDAGFTVHGWDIEAQRRDAFADHGGSVVPLATGVAQSRAIVCVVLNAEQLDTLLFGPEGIASAILPEAVVIACATIPADAARRMAARARDCGFAYLDAPISGGAVRAREGALSIMASGSADAFARARPVLDAVAATVHDLGPDAGTGSAMKSVNQLLAGVHIAAMGEALAYAVQQGLPLDRTIEVISQSAGTSWMFENRAPHVRDGDYAPRSAVGIWPKDLNIVLDAARGGGLTLPLAQAALAQFERAVAEGDGALDDAAVTLIHARAAGLDVPGAGR